MSKKLSRIIGTIMLIVAMAFVIYALTHPEWSWTFPLNIVYMLYAAYLIVMVIFFVAPFKKKQ